MNENDVITKREGYVAMLLLLEKYYKNSGSTDLTYILSGGGISENGEILDKDFWNYCIESFESQKI